MKIKIIQCSKGSYWYADAIGHMYNVKKELDDAYIIMKCPTVEYWVMKEDAEVV